MKYRVFKNINWGPNYNPATKAHHCDAQSPDEASAILRPSPGDGFQTMQVETGSGWKWVTETPTWLGGISRS